MNEVPRHEHPPKGEWTKFVVLVLILAGTIVVIALLRPLIFGRIVPAVLGENLEQTTVTPAQPSDVEGDAASSNGSDEQADDSSEEMDSEAGGGSPDEAADEADSSESDEESSESEESTVEDETAVSSDETKTHTVTIGQTLSQIAREYDISVESIIEANNLTNPNVVRIGDELIIPNE